MYTKAGIQSLGLQTYNFNLSNWILHTLGLSVRGELATCASQESQSKWCISTSRIQALTLGMFSTDVSSDFWALLYLPESTSTSSMILIMMLKTLKTQFWVWFLTTFNCQGFTRAGSTSLRVFRIPP